MSSIRVFSRIWGAKKNYHKIKALPIFIGRPSWAHIARLACFNTARYKLRNQVPGSVRIEGPNQINRVWRLHSRSQKANINKFFGDIDISRRISAYIYIQTGQLYAEMKSYIANPQMNEPNVFFFLCKYIYSISKDSLWKVVVGFQWAAPQAICPRAHTQIDSVFIN